MAFLKRYVVLLLAMLVAASAAQAASPIEERLGQLQARYRCPVMAYLVAIHRAPFTFKDRYLILSSIRRPEFYVQCYLDDEDSSAFCEAASGFYEDTITDFATPEQLAMLAALGFTTDGSEGNFQQTRPLSDLEAYYDMAGMMVETLARVYDFSLDDVLEYQAPIVGKSPGEGVAGSRHCKVLTSMVKDGSGGGLHEDRAPIRRRADALAQGEAGWKMAPEVRAVLALSSP